VDCQYPESLEQALSGGIWRCQVIGVLIYCSFFSGAWVCPAVKNVRGEYYLNGHWTIDFSRALHVASTVMHYDRGSEGDLAPEILHARGPTTEPLVIEVSSCACSPLMFSLPRFVQQRLLCAVGMHWSGLRGEDWRSDGTPGGLWLCCPVRSRARLDVGFLPVLLGTDFKGDKSQHQMGLGRGRALGHCLL